MADKKVNLIISLKDGVSAGLAGIRSGISATADAFKKIAVAGLGATTAIVGGLTMLAKKYAEAEAASNRLSSTFTALGENGKAAAKVWGDYAASIQKITTVDDEVVLGLVNTAKIMGVSNDSIKQATESAIGLSKAFGLDLDTAMKMTVMSMSGNYDMLARYIPALREATSEGEKAAIVQQAMATGWQIAQQEMNTISGAWGMLKNAISDAMETAGQVIFGEGGLAAGILKIKDYIVGLSEDGTIAKWAENFKQGLSEVSQAIQILFKGGEGASNVMRGLGSVIMAAFTDAVTTAVNVFIKAAPTIGMAISDAIIGGVKQAGSSFLGMGERSEKATKAMKESGVKGISEKDDFYQAEMARLKAEENAKYLKTASDDLSKQFGISSDNLKIELEKFKEMLADESERAGVSDIFSQGLAGITTRGISSGGGGNTGSVELDISDESSDRLARTIGEEVSDPRNEDTSRPKEQLEFNAFPNARQNSFDPLTYQSALQRLNSPSGISSSIGMESISGIGGNSDYIKLIYEASEKTNILLDEMTKLHAERMGGVKN